jgi:methylmalonyl-CoA mutase
MANTLDLHIDFPPVSKNEWLAKIEKDLKGKPLSSLEWQLDHLDIDPFPHLDDLKELPLPAGEVPGWEIGEDIGSHDLLVANRQVRQALEFGVEAPRFILDENLGDHRMATLLEGVDLSLVSIHFFEKNKNADPRHLLEHFYHIARDAGKDPRTLRGSVNWSIDEAVVIQDAFELIEIAQHKLPGFKVLPVNGHAYFKEGEIISELAQLVNRAVEWTDGLEELGLPFEQSNHFLHFSISTGQNYFVEIAKIRALKMLWANVMKAYGAEKFEMPPIEAHVTGASQKDDPHTNMIMATTQAMSAVIGGANRLTVQPSDAFSGQSTDFSRRIARNVQHILKMESHFDWVTDPAAGSYFVENLTVKLAAAAWERFQKM